MKVVVEGCGGWRSHFAANNFEVEGDDPPLGHGQGRWGYFIAHDEQYLVGA